MGESLYNQNDAVVQFYIVCARLNRCLSSFFKMQLGGQQQERE